MEMSWQAVNVRYNIPFYFLLSVRTDCLKDATSVGEYPVYFNQVLSPNSNSYCRQSELQQEGRKTNQSATLDDQDKNDSNHTNSSSCKRVFRRRG